MKTLPKIGELWIEKQPIDLPLYAGLTLHDNEAYALVLLPGDFEGTWSNANEWAKKQGGELPSRIDALVQWQNVPGHFKKGAYWTSEQHADDAVWAWYQRFDYGYQGSSGKSSKLRARAVRRVHLT